MRAWLFTILRNTFYSYYRKKKREVEDVDGVFSEKLCVDPEHNGHMDLKDFEKALITLPETQREAIILVGAFGMSYDEAAFACGVAVGTIKSRVSRARLKLAEILDIQPSFISEDNT
jgi:RNA polymerase sigma-70 factor (ECF subfamily)